MSNPFCAWKYFPVPLKIGIVQDEPTQHMLKDIPTWPRPKHGRRIKFYQNLKSLSIIKIKKIINEVGFTNVVEIFSIKKMKCVKFHKKFLTYE